MTSGAPLRMVMELVKGKSLFKYLYSTDEKMTPIIRVKIGLDVARGE